ncbi:hypothetical protein Tco_1542730, partial [Tanacetum coccineum]
MANMLAIPPLSLENPVDFCRSGSWQELLVLKKLNSIQQFLAYNLLTGTK